MPINSKRHRLRLLSGVLAIFLSLGSTLTAMLNLPPAQANHHPAITPRAPANTGDVSIAGFAFNPAAITITAGTVVTWTNLDGTAHTTTNAAGSSDPWDSGNLNPGDVFTRTFSTLGTYAYHCLIHSDMTGTVMVVTQVYLPLALR